MAVSRYSGAPIIRFGAAIGTTRAISSIRSAIADGTLNYKTLVVRGRERLDTIAFTKYGDGRYWWVLAAASGIGWGLQVPPGTLIKVPPLEDVLSFVV